MLELWPSLCLHLMSSISSNYKYVFNRNDSLKCSICFQQTYMSFPQVLLYHRQTTLDHTSSGKVSYFPNIYHAVYGVCSQEINHL